MPAEGQPAPPASSLSGGCTYTFSSTITEDKDPDPKATYGVQFCQTPSPFYLKGGGSVWVDNCEVHAKPSPGCKGAHRQEDPNHEGSENKGEKESYFEHERGTADCSHETLDSDIEITEVNAGTKMQSWPDLFATCNSIFVRIYEAQPKRKPLLLQEYEDCNKREEFYCVAWTFNVDGKAQWWACAAGANGVVRVLNVQRRTLEKSLTGHGQAVNDLKVHPRDPSLLLSASRDESLRLWNLRTGATIAIFAGLKGHRGQVLFVDFDRDGDRFASCGIDNCVRLWRFKEDEKVMRAVIESHKAADTAIDCDAVLARGGGPAETEVPMCQFPYFVTKRVHKHYVDCVMWVGDLLLSKSIHNRMFLWEPGPDRKSLASPTSEYTLLEEYVLRKCDVWFIRFAMDRDRRLVACGDDQGIVLVFDLGAIPSSPLCELHPKKKVTDNFVRQCSFSKDGSILIAVDDASNVVQYEREVNSTTTGVS